jgi:dTDP-4-dehydrorhamnose 3,5-epimerase
MLLIPPGFGNGIQSLEDGSIYYYKQTTYYVPNTQFTLAYDDPSVNVAWPREPVMVSQRDRDGFSLSMLRTALPELRKVHEVLGIGYPGLR